MQTGLLQRCALIALIVLVASAWSSSASAQTSASRTNQPPRQLTAAPGAFVAASEPVSETHWYGWQTLLVDGGALSMVVGGFWLRPAHQDWSVVSIAGIGAWAVGPPVV